jgi:hypothetical protein
MRQHAFFTLPYGSSSKLIFTLFCYVFAFMSTPHLSSPSWKATFSKENVTFIKILCMKQVNKRWHNRIFKNFRPNDFSVRQYFPGKSFPFAQIGLLQQRGVWQIDAYNKQLMSLDSVTSFLLYPLVTLGKRHDLSVSHFFHMGISDNALIVNYLRVKCGILLKYLVCCKYSIIENMVIGKKF